MKRVSVSVDDGYPADIKVAEILGKKGIAATFYIPIKNADGLPVINRSQISSLAESFEIGGHTYSHQDLTKMPIARAKREIVDGKKALEDIVGKKINAFAPPKGKYNEAIIGLTRQAGFTSFRSARILNFKNPNFSNFLWHPNLHLYPHSFLTEVLHLIKHGDFYSLVNRASIGNTTHLKLLDLFKKRESPYHVWLHSWEIENYNLWGWLEKL